jgi:hypothetical protein
MPRGRFPWLRWAAPSFLALAPALAAPPDTSPFASRPEPIGTAGWRAAPLEAGLRIDGALDEPPWAEAPPLGDFRQQVPRAEEPASEATEVRILYDARTLFIGVKCFDREPQRILVRTLARDAFDLLADDLFVVSIDPALTGRDGFWFATNAAGAQFDAQVFNEGRIFDTAWDGVWESAARQGPEGWTAEIAIPLDILRFDAGRDRTMGFIFQRLIRRRNEEAYLPYIPRDYGRETAFSRAMLVDFQETSRGVRLQIKPHILAARRVAIEPTGDEDTLGRSGVDLKWGATPTLTADFTLNTDFGETEVDQQQINLTRFPLFFPEKREFFLENAGLLQFGIPEETQVFFSRRIGLEDGEPIPIRAGARLSGRVGPVTLAALDALQRDTPESERTNFGALRARADIGERGSAGVIFTDRRADSFANRVAGADFLWPFRGEYRAEGFVTGSRTGGSGGDGAAAHARLAREGDLWRWSLEWTRVDPGFDPAIGFVLRPDMRRARASLAWQPRPHDGPVRQWRMLYSPTFIYDSQDRLASRLHFAQGEAEFHSGDTVGAFFLEDFERLLGPFEIVPGVIIPPGDYDNHEAQASVATSGNRLLSGSAFANLGDFFGGRRRIAGASVLARLGAHLSAGGEFVHNRVRLPAGEFSTRLSLIRLRYAFTPRLFGGVLLQSNSLTDEVGVNLRLDWIYRPGCDLFFVYNRLFRTPVEPFQSDLDREATLVKVVHLIRF